MSGQTPEHKVAKPYRAIVYIDGFNLYFGLKSKRWKRYYWLDMWLLAERLARRRRLEGVKYFTACVRDDPPKELRQQAFLNALRSHRPRLEIVYGHFLLKEVQCRRCAKVWRTAEEKKTDVIIATHLLRDAFHNSFDTAIIVSGDGDLAPPIETVLIEMPAKRVTIAFPPDRFSAELQRVASSSFHINQQAIRNSLLPDPVVKPDGTRLRKPVEWI